MLFEAIDLPMIQPAALSRPAAAGPLAFAPAGDGATFDLSFASIADTAAVVAVASAGVGQPPAAPGNALPPTPAPVVSPAMPDIAPMVTASPVPPVSTPVHVDPVATMLLPIAQALAEAAEPMPDDPAPPPAPPPVIPSPQTLVRSRQTAAPAPASVPTRRKDQTPPHETADDGPPTNDVTTMTTMTTITTTLPDMSVLLLPLPVPVPVAMQASASPDAIAAMIVRAPVAQVEHDRPQAAVASVTRAATAAPMPVEHEAAIERIGVESAAPVADAAIPPTQSPMAPTPVAAASPIPDPVDHGEPVFATPSRAVGRSAVPSPVRSTVAPQAPVVADPVPVDIAITPKQADRTMREEPTPTPPDQSVVDPVIGPTVRATIAATSILPAAVGAVDRPVSPSRGPTDAAQAAVVGPAVASAAFPSAVPGTDTARPDAPPIGVQPVAVAPVPTPGQSLAPVATPASPTAVSAPPVARPVADVVDADPPATGHMTPTPVVRAEPPVAAIPTLAIVAGTTAPAFRMFAQAIHDARRDDTTVDPVAAAPIAAIEPPRIAPPVGDSQGGTLDLGDHRWPHAMVDRIERLRDAASAAADAADTSIRLVPDALGTIDVSVRRDGDTVHVRFTAEQAATRALLTEAQPRLADLAEARGIKLGQASVDGGHAGSGQQPGQRQPSAPQSRFDAPARVGVRTEDPTLETTRIA